MKRSTIACLSGLKKAMRIEIDRFTIHIIPENEQDAAFIEDTMRISLACQNLLGEMHQGVFLKGIIVGQLRTLLTARDHGMVHHTLVMVKRAVTQRL